jgi:hypothetical protein
VTLYTASTHHSANPSAHPTARRKPGAHRRTTRWKALRDRLRTLYTPEVR